MFSEFGCCNTLPYSGPNNYYFDTQLFTVCPSKNAGFDPAGVQNRMTMEEFQSLMDLIKSQCGGDVTCIKITRVLGLVIVFGIIIAWIADAITSSQSGSATTSYILFALSLFGLLFLIYAAVKKRTIIRNVQNILDQENYTRSAQKDLRWSIDFRGRWFHVHMNGRAQGNQSSYNNSMVQMMPYGNYGGYGQGGYNQYPQAAYGQPVYGQPVGPNVAYQSVPITTVPLSQPYGNGQQQQQQYGQPSYQQ